MDMQAQIPLTMCTVKATLAAGSGSTLSTTSSVSGYLAYCIKGKAYTLANLSSTTTPTTDYATGNAFLPVPANYGSVYTIGLTAAGDLKVVQGTVVALDAGGSFIKAPQFGGLPDNFCPIGYEVIKADSTASSAPGWMFGTNNQSSVTGITYTLVDVMGMPSRPQVS